MTNGQKKAEDFLKKIRDVERMLKTKHDELDALRYKASGAGAITYNKDRVQSSPQDFMSMVMDDIVKIEKEIRKEEAGIENKKAQALHIIHKIPVQEQRTIILWYYFNGISMTDTALKMSIAERTAYYLRDEALESFGHLM